MAVDVTRATPEHAQAIGRIFFVSFDELARRHGFVSEVFSPEFAQKAAESMVRRPDMYGIVAVEGGEVVGLNFVQLADAVAGIGPMCIDPNHQSRGLGRLLMQCIIDYSLASHGPMVRLYQESFNLVSLSLYTDLGFTVTDPVVVMSVPPGSDPDVRPLTVADVDAADALVIETQKVSRRNELRGAIENGPRIGCVPQARMTGGNLTGVVVPGFFGFAAGKTPQDVINTARVGCSAYPPPMRRIIIPTRNGELYRYALRSGLRSLKVGQMMAMGPFETPSGHWAPSVAY